MNRLWHERCFYPLHERRIDPTDPKSEPGNSAERARQRIEIEQTRKRKNGQEETGVIAIVFKPAARGPAKQSRSSRDRHGDFLGCPGTDLRGIRLGVAHNFAEVIAEAAFPPPLICKSVVSNLEFRLKQLALRRQLASGRLDSFCFLFDFRQQSPEFAFL
jgi:hypothetical protein